MREIKYRAWHKREKKMYDVLGIRLGVQYGMGPNERCNYVDLVDHSETYIQGEEVDLMQFTSLKDIKGIDIYEGDIVEIRNLYDIQCAQVVWGDFYSLNQWDMSETWILRFAKIQGRAPINAPLYPYCHFDMRITVIGDIHNNNKELLEQ